METPQPLVTIVIPAYNQAQYLRQAVDSALAQTYPHREIIVVNDGSTDETAAIAGSYGDRIKVIHQENRGLAGARNTGIRAANGDWISLLDADDIWTASYLARMMELAASQPQADVFYCRARCMDTAGVDLGQVMGGGIFSPDMLYQTLLRANFLIPSTITLRRAVAVDAGLFDQSLRSCEDWDMWLRLLPESLFVGTDDVLVRYRVHPKSLSANVIGMHQAKKSVVEKHFGLDDGHYANWSADKKRAYAGLYRYFLITSVLRRGEWQSAGVYLSKALQIDPSTACDLDLFYELSLGTQPVGLRDSKQRADVQANAKEIEKVLSSAFEHFPGSTRELQRQARGTACNAIGLCAYNTGDLRLSRRYLSRAIYFRPGLIFKSSSLWLKTLLGDRILNQIRRRRLS